MDVPRATGLGGLTRSLENLREMRPELGAHIDRVLRDARSLAESMERLSELIEGAEDGKV